MVLVCLIMGTRNAHGRHLYYLQFDASPFSGEVTVEAELLSDEERLELINHSICSSAFQAVFLIGKKRMQSIRSDMNSYGVKKKHGNIGKKRGYPEDSPIMLNLRKSFGELHSLGEVRATRSVALLVVCWLALSSGWRWA